MTILEITSREFREKQKDFFDKADSGNKIVIKRGKKQAYLLVPIVADDIYFTPKMLEKITVSIQQAKENKTTRIKTEDELSNFLDNL